MWSIHIQCINIKYVVKIFFQVVILFFPLFLGLELSNDNKNCIEPEAFLVYSRKNVIGLISVENENNDAVLPIRELKEVR